MQVVLWWLVVVLVLTEMNVVVEGPKGNTLGYLGQKFQRGSSSDGTKKEDQMRLIQSDDESEESSSDEEGKVRLPQSPPLLPENPPQRNPEILDWQSQDIVERYNGGYFKRFMEWAKQRKGGRWVFWIEGSDGENWRLVGRQVESKEKVKAREKEEKKEKTEEEEKETKQKRKEKQKEKKQWTPYNCKLELIFSREVLLDNMQEGWERLKLEDGVLEPYSQEVISQAVKQLFFRGRMAFNGLAADSKETVKFWWVQKEANTTVACLKARGYKEDRDEEARVVTEYSYEAYGTAQPKFIVHNLTLVEDK